MPMANASAARTRKAGRVMTTLNDEQLLQCIATRRDREAFQALFDRLGPKAFSLALYLSGNRAKAEEAVQDAMLSVWLKAGRFEPERGTAKAWLLRIVANKAIQSVRKEKTERNREMNLRQDTVQMEAAAPEAEERKEELVGAVREKFAELPDAFRQVLALYFAAEMSQEEISKALAIPQSTISLRIRQGLDDLRRRLKGAGYAAALPLVTSNGFGDALLNGTEVPEGLGAQILQRLGSAAEHSVRAAAATKGATGLWIALGVMAAAAAGLAASGPWTANNDTNSAPAEKNPADAKVQAPAPAPDAQPGKLFQHRWTFEDSKDPYMILNGDNCQFIKGAGWQGSGGLKTIRPTEVRFFKVPMDRFPMRFSYKAKLVDEAQTGSSIRPSWNDASFRTFGVFHNIFKPQAPAPGREGWHEYTTYVTPNLMFYLLDGAPELLAYVEMAEKRELAVIINGVYLVDDLRFEQIEEKDVPDLSHFQAAAAAIPPSQRTGRQALRSLSDQDKLQPAYLEFLLSPVQPLKKDEQATTAPNQAPDRKE